MHVSAAVLRGRGGAHPEQTLALHVHVEPIEASLHVEILRKLAALARAVAATRCDAGWCWCGAPVRAWLASE